MSFNYNNKTIYSQAHRHNSGFAEGLTTDLASKGFSVPNDTTASSYKFVLYDKNRNYHGMPWGNLPASPPYKYRDDFFLAADANIPTPDRSISSGTHNYISEAKTVSHYLKYNATNNTTSFYYDGSTSPYHAFSGGSLIILACAQGGGGGGLVENGVADYSLNGYCVHYPETPAGGKGGTVERHTTVNGITLAQAIDGRSGGTGGAEGDGVGNDSSINLSPSKGTDMAANTLAAPMLATPPTLAARTGGTATEKYIDSWWEGWGGGGGASAMGNGGNGGYLPSNRDNTADDGGTGTGYGGGGGGGGLIHDFWDDYNRSKGGNGASGIIYFLWKTKEQY